MIEGHCFGTVNYMESHSSISTARQGMASAQPLGGGVQSRLFRVSDRRLADVVRQRERSTWRTSSWRVSRSECGSSSRQSGNCTPWSVWCSCGPFRGCCVCRGWRRSRKCLQNSLRRFGIHLGWSCRQRRQRLSPTSTGRTERGSCLLWSLWTGFWWGQLAILSKTRRRCSDGTPTRLGSPPPTPGKSCTRSAEKASSLPRIGTHMSQSGVAPSLTSSWGWTLFMATAGCRTPPQTCFMSAQTRSYTTPLALESSTTSGSTPSASSRNTTMISTAWRIPLSASWQLRGRSDQLVEACPKFMFGSLSSADRTGQLTERRLGRRCRRCTSWSFQSRIVGLWPLPFAPRGRSWRRLPWTTRTPCTYGTLARGRRKSSGSLRIAGTRWRRSRLCRVLRQQHLVLYGANSTKTRS
mmetsp:Transcript_4185/g.7657  ORF Transcript_4185/g.7657 Transcript_4185/m.7657 type:complete len:410 (-) Transcript_4185:2041-3270(-)